MILYYACFTQQYILELISYQYIRYFLLLFYVGELWKEDFNEYVLWQKVKKEGIGHSLEEIVNKLQMTERKKHNNPYFACFFSKDKDIHIGKCRIDIMKKGLKFAIKEKNIVRWCLDSL